jgi:hypothetical protein
MTSIAPEHTIRADANPSTLFAIAITLIAVGGVIGALTNAINGAVSPLYFVTIMHWYNVENVWRAAIAQGIFEGSAYGALFSLVFTIVVGTAPGFRIPYSFTIKHIVTAVAVTILCWCIGGFIALGLATLSPEFYQNAFIGVPDDFFEMLRYAWVGGSIWGAMFGAVLSVIIASISVRTDWWRRVRLVSS